jgi:hypothetical protein
MPASSVIANRKGSRSSDEDFPALDDAGVWAISQRLFARGDYQCFLRIGSMKIHMCVNPGDKRRHSTFQPKVLSVWQMRSTEATGMEG